MPALSKKQQRFFGIVRAIQKGEQAPTTPETAKVARDMKKGEKGYKGVTPVGKIKNRLAQKRKKKDNPYRARAGESD